MVSLLQDLENLADELEGRSSSKSGKSSSKDHPDAPPRRKTAEEVAEENLANLEMTAFKAKWQQKKITRKANKAQKALDRHIRAGRTKQSRTKAIEILNLTKQFEEVEELEQNIQLAAFGVEADLCMAEVTAELDKTVKHMKRMAIQPTNYKKHGKVMKEFHKVRSDGKDIRTSFNAHFDPSLQPSQEDDERISDIIKQSEDRLGISLPNCIQQKISDSPQLEPQLTRVAEPVMLGNLPSVPKVSTRKVQPQPLPPPTVLTPGQIDIQQQWLDEINGGFVFGEKLYVEENGTLVESKIEEEEDEEEGDELDQALKRLKTL